MRKIQIVTILLIILLCISTNIFASTNNTFNIEMQTNGTTISKEQNEVILYVFLSKYEGDGMLGYEAKLEYDKNVFESATITALNDWDKVVYDSVTGKFVSTTTNAKVQTKIAQITLKLKTNITAKTTQVKINNFIVSDGNVEDTFNRTVVYNFANSKENEDIDENVQDNITEDPILPNIVVDTGTTQKQETPTQVKQETPKQLTVESVQKTETDNTKAQTTIPQTGTTMVGTIIISIVILLGIIGYIKYRSIKLK